LTLDFSFDKSKGDNRKELVIVGKERTHDSASLREDLKGIRTINDQDQSRKLTNRRKLRL
jgi:hypothetical protein